MMVTTHSPAETMAWANQWATQLRPGDVIALTGPLGAGKTCFIQGLARGLGVPPDVHVNSPTFVLCNIYVGRFPLYHFDWYRLGAVEELDALGLEEFFDGVGITVVEWGDKFSEALPERTIWVEMKSIAWTNREIKIRNPKQISNPKMQ